MLSFTNEGRFDAVAFTRDVDSAIADLTRQLEELIPHSDPQLVQAARDADAQALASGGALDEVNRSTSWLGYQGDDSPKGQGLSPVERHVQGRQATLAPAILNQRQDKRAQLEAHLAAARDLASRWAAIDVDMYLQAADDLARLRSVNGARNQRRRHALAALSAARNRVDNAQASALKRVEELEKALRNVERLLQRKPEDDMLLGPKTRVESAADQRVWGPASPTVFPGVRPRR